MVLNPGGKNDRYKRRDQMRDKLLELVEDEQAFNSTGSSLRNCEHAYVFKKGEDLSKIRETFRKNNMEVDTKVDTAELVAFHIADQEL